MMFQKSDKFKNTLLVFINKILLKLVKKSRFFAQKYVKQERRYYKLVLNLLYRCNFVMSSFSVREVAA